MLRDPTTFDALLTFPDWPGPLQDVAFDATGRWIAFAGTDSEVGLWDLGLVRDELAAMGLAWDRPAPAITSLADLAPEGQQPRSRVPVIAPGNIDPAELDKARRLFSSGVAAYEERRLPEALADLEQARDRFESLRAPRPTDEVLTRQHGTSLGFLGSTLRDLKRPGEALASFQRSLAVLESMLAPRAIDLYNMACGRAMVSALDDRATPDERENHATRAVADLKTAIESDPQRIPPMIASDSDLDPLRARADFRDLMADAGFPRDPFKQPSPLAGFESLATDERRSLSELSRQIERDSADFQKRHARGDFLARRGSWAAAAVDYRKALELNPPTKWDNPDGTIFAMEAAVVLIQAGDRDGYRRLGRAMIDRFAGSMASNDLERTAKVNLLLPPPADDLKRLEAMARSSVDLGQGTPWLGWFQMVHGMSAYRSGEFAKAVESFTLAGQSDQGQEHRSTCKSYLAMAELRLGHTEQARSLLRDAGELIAGRAMQKDIGDDWHNFWIADMARREADALINPASAPATEPAGP